MATNPYIELENSTATVTERFRVIHGSYNVRRSKASNLRKTLGGKLDMAVGAVFLFHSYVIRVRETEPVANYGDLGQLEYFYDLNNPNGTPNNIIAFTDHFQTAHNAYMIGELEKQILSVEVEGQQAWYLVGVQLVEIP